MNLTSGTVYYAFDRADHVSKVELLPMNGSPVCFCFDFNVFPYSVSWCQILNDENIRFLGEWVSKVHSNTEEACDEIMKRLPPDVDVVIFGDASGRRKILFGVSLTPLRYIFGQIRSIPLSFSGM